MESIFSLHLLLLLKFGAKLNKETLDLSPVRGVQWKAHSDSNWGDAVHHTNAGAKARRRVVTAPQIEIPGRQVADVAKHKPVDPFRDAEFEIHFDEGISKTSDILDLGTKLELIQKSGTWLSFENEKLGQGRESARAFLKENPKVLAKIEKQIRDKISIKPK